MKVKIRFTQTYEREVEMSPRDYFFLNLDKDAIPGIFPEGAENREFSKFSELDSSSRMEIEKLYNKIVGKG